MRAFVLAGILVVAMAQASPVDNSAGLKAVNDGANGFSSNFFKTVSEDSASENLISSPLSVNVVLAMLSLGAKGNTLKQLQSGLHLPTDESLFKSGYESLMNKLNNVENVELKLANKIFDAKKNELKPEYAANVKDIFKSEIEKVDFENSAAAAKRINDWASASTNNKIKELFKPDAFDANTALVLANAIYFKGQWAKQFDPARTIDAPFHVDEKTVKNVPTMYKKERFNNGIIKDMAASWIELPYKGNEFSLLIIMPDQINGLASLQANLSKINIAELLNSGNNYELELYLPKFKIESELKLKPILEKMGMSDMFTDSANLSGISSAPLKVSDAIQKAFIEVNEEGSEAAAVTVVTMMVMSAMIFNEEFRVNHPFFYLIIQKQTNPNNKLTETVMPLFLGTVKQPKY